MTDKSPAPESTPARPVVTARSSRGLTLLLALPAICCGLPLLVGALVASGAAGWLSLHGYLAGGAVAGTAAILLWWGRRPRRC